MVGLTGGAGTYNSEGIVYEWSDVIAVFKDGAIVDYFTQFAGDALPTSLTDVSIGAFNVQLTQLGYRHLGNAVGVNALTLGSGAQFTQAADGFVIDGKLTNNGLMIATAPMTFSGAIENNHLMTLGDGNANDSGNWPYMRLSPVNGDFTISGSGDMRLRYGFLTGEGGQSSVTDLINSSKISGYGRIGSEFGLAEFPTNAGYLAITNTAAGTIEADVAGQELIVQTQLTDANPIVNAGILAASGGGILRLIGSGTPGNSAIYIEQSGAGTIRAYTNSFVALDNAAVIGGTLDGQGTGVISFLGGPSERLVDVDITASALVNVGSRLVLEGAIENRGRMVASLFQNTTTIDAAGVTLTGGGTFQLMGNRGFTQIVGQAPGTVLTNADHTILGWGGILGANLSVVNSGVISATPDSYSLVDADSLVLGDLAGLRNSGILQANGHATLTLSGIQGVVNNDGGTIRAIGADSRVGLAHVTISGGTLATTSNGVIGADSNGVQLINVQTLAGTNINASEMTLEGAIVNRGTMSVNNYNASLYINNTVQLSGGGTVLLLDNYDTSKIVSATAGSVLTNLAGHTIRGDGFIGGSNLTLINAGLIYADADPYDDFDSLQIDDLATFTNTGFLEARNGATLDLDTPISGVIQNAGGTIRATGAGSVVDLNDNVIAGGTLNAVSGGTFTFSNATWDGRVTALSSDVEMALVDARLTVMGTIVNSGDVSFAYRSGLIIGENTTLSGGGSFTINTGYEPSFFWAPTAGVTLTNLDNTLGGTGGFGDFSGMVLINESAGVITANQAGGLLRLHTGAVITNNGVISANGGILDLRDKVVGTGRLEVTNGGTLIVDQGSDQRVAFVGTSADTLHLSLRVVETGGFEFPISGMGVGDRITLDAYGDAGAEADFTLSYTATGTVLASSVFSDGTENGAYQIGLEGVYSYGQFQLIGGVNSYYGSEVYSYVRVATHDGGSGADVLTAAISGERVIGLDGDDTLISRQGDDLLDGSRGNDTADFRWATSGVTVSLAIANPQAVGGGLGTDQLISIENLTGSRFNDRLTGDMSANMLSGGAGDDMFNAGLGNDTVDGGSGRDTATISDSRSAITVVLSGSDTIITSTAGTDSYRNVEFFQFNDQTLSLGQVRALGVPAQVLTEVRGTGGDDRLDGTSADNFLNGLAGNDSLFGNGGSDSLLGGTERDYIYGDGYRASYHMDEARAVYRLYQATLDRAPDTAGQASWTARLAEGTHTLQQVSAGFVGSPEFQAVYAGVSKSGFVELLYQNVLGRAPEAGGLAGWIARMDGGMTKAQVVLGLSESAEFRTATNAAATNFTTEHNPANWSDDVYRLYHATLDREPDLGGFNAWSGRLANGMDYLTAASSFVNSPEFQKTYSSLSNSGFVSLLYQNVLGRAGDADGLKSWTALLDGGTAKAQVVKGFAQSGEFITSTAAGLNAWVQAQGVDDTLNGGAGQNDLWGGSMTDVFQFTMGDGGFSLVHDLEAWDYLSFQGFGYTTAADALSHMTQLGADSIFTDQGKTAVLFEDQGTKVVFLASQLSMITADSIWL